MHNKTVLFITLLLFLTGLAAFIGCGSKSKVCTISPIDIEELKADNRDLDTQLAEVRERLAREQETLASWQQKVAERKSQPPQLKLELARLKKQSGVTEEIVETTTEKTEQALEIKPTKRGAE